MQPATATIYDERRGIVVVLLLLLQLISYREPVPGTSTLYACQVFPHTQQAGLAPWPSAIFRGTVAMIHLVTTDTTVGELAAAVKNLYQY